MPSSANPQYGEQLAQSHDWFQLAWRLLVVLFMFAPYAVSASADSMWKGLRESIGAWTNCGYNLLSFTAFGAAALGAILMLSNLLYDLSRVLPWPLSDVPALIVMAIRAAAGMVMAVAVWEFYQQIKAASADEFDEIDATDRVDALEA